MAGASGSGWGQAPYWKERDAALKRVSRWFDFALLAQLGCVFFWFSLVATLLILGVIWMWRHL